MNNQNQQIKKDDSPEWIVDKVNKIIKTDAGEFHIHPTLFEAYHTKAQPTPEHFDYPFAGDLSRATVPESFNAEWNRNGRTKIPTDRLDSLIEEMMNKHKLNPKEFLDKYNQYNERTKELWQYLTPELREQLTEQNLLYTFSNRSANDAHIWLEHKCIASSTGMFFGNPFMGGYTHSKEKREEIKQKRKGFNTGIILVDRKKNYFDKVNHYYTKEQPHPRTTLARTIKQGLSTLYNKKFTFARLVLSPVPFDDELRAFSKPTSIDFINGKKLVYSHQDPALLSRLAPTMEDVRLADTVHYDGKKMNVQIETCQGIHQLTQADKNAVDWYQSYMNKIAQELNK